MPGHVALLVGQLRLVADAHDRAHRVEEARQQHREDEQDAGQHADLAEAAEEADLADEPEVGVGDRVAGPLGEVSPHGRHRRRRRR